MVWNIIIPISSDVDAGTILYGMAAALVEGVLRMALWAIRESEKKVEGFKAEGGIRELDKILNNPALDKVPELRQEIERQRSDLRQTASR